MPQQPAKAPATPNNAKIIEQQAARIEELEQEVEQLCETDMPLDQLIDALVDQLNEKPVAERIEVFSQLEIRLILKDRQARRQRKLKPAPKKPARGFTGVDTDIGE